MPAVTCVPSTSKYSLFYLSPTDSNIRKSVNLPRPPWSWSRNTQYRVLLLPVKRPQSSCWLFCHFMESQQRKLTHSLYMALFWLGMIYFIIFILFKPNTLGLTVSTILVCNFVPVVKGLRAQIARQMYGSRHCTVQLNSVCSSDPLCSRPLGQSLHVDLQ